MSGGAVEKYFHPPQSTIRSGDCVAVCDGAHSCFAYGFFNENSLFRVPILRHLSDSNQETPTQLPSCYQDDIVDKTGSGRYHPICLVT